MKAFGILRQRKYSLVAVGAFAAVAAVSAFLMVIVSWPALVYDGMLLLAPELQWDGVLYWLAFSSLASLAITMTLAKYDKLRKAGLAGGTAGFLGMAVGSAASACPVCAPLLLVFLGVPLSLASLPLGGWEFRVGGIALLAVSAYAAAESIEGGEACLTKPARNAARQ